MAISRRSLIAVCCVLGLSLSHAMALVLFHHLQRLCWLCAFACRWCGLRRHLTGSCTVPSLCSVLVRSSRRCATVLLHFLVRRRASPRWIIITSRPAPV